MTEFLIEGRQYCRNPKCRMKLAKPIINERNAFCAAGCKRQFYRFRCFVCEEPMERKTEGALTCGKRKCDAGLTALRDLPGYQPPRQPAGHAKKPVNAGVDPPVVPDRGNESTFRAIAGPPLPPSQFHCATAGATEAIAAADKVNAAHWRAAMERPGWSYARTSERLRQGPFHDPR
jgi:hypothetical protein